ncbi:MAG: hypothetical protein HQ536_02390 [Parcubacteria group bacterium]|nr:hypothetical protein [Parcubacteria group bacterium]
MNASIWFFSVSALVNAVTSTVLGIYVISTNYKKRVARYLFYFCVTVALWSYCYFVWQISKDAESALFWSRGLMFGAIFTSISYLHLVLVFLNLDKLKFYKITLLFFYFFTFIWVIANFTSYFVNGVEARSYFKFWPIPGPFYAPYLISFGVHVVYASVLLFKRYIHSRGPDRIQSGLLLAGIFLAFVGGSTNYPLWYNINFAPWGNVLVSIYVVLTVYSILKYKFLDIRVVSAELFTGIFFVVFLVDVFLSKNSIELFFRVLALVIMLVFGVMLIRSVRREVKRREEVTQLARSLEKANIRLKELDKQKTEFLSIASHQLRTPLSVSTGYIELIKDGAYGKVSKGVLEILDNMDESNGHLIKLVEDFLNVSRIEQGRTKFEFADVDMTQLVEGVVKELAQRAIDKGLKIVWKKPITKIKSIYVDEERIRHVVFNFIDNAIKYSDKGKINVSLSLSRDNSGIVVRVKDNGIGFGKKDEANFFQKFYRGENVKGINVNGTGLGLYVCRRFVETHKGSIWAKSKGKGKGSEFEFYLPFKGIK